MIKCKRCNKILGPNQIKYCSRQCSNKHNRPHLKYNESEIIQLYLNGESTVAIGRKLKCDPRTIGRILSRNGIVPINTKHRVSSPKKAAQLYDSGFSMKDTGRKLGITQSTVYRYLKEIGTKSRSQARPGSLNGQYDKKGPLSSNWKPPHLRKTILIAAIRNCWRYKEWRTKVYNRDNYTCIKCKDSTGGNLEADHIIPFALLLRKYQIKTLEDALECEQLWEVENGRTLCVNCHKKTKTWGNGTRKIICQYA